MSASIFVVRPSVSGEMSPADYQEQPGFYNDYQAFASFLAAVDDDPAVRAQLTALDLAPMLALTTDGMDDAAVDWTAPSALGAAARRLQSLVEAQDESVEALVARYDEGANHIDDTQVELARDLDDLAKLADWANERGWPRVAIKVSW